ncbi:MAG TPA: FAD-dependent oxidoreductase [Solirubrobacteraceae bacterium]
MGGGPAALAAALELTAPEAEDRFEVTIYQPGWRLGGKCASGRNLSRGGRIEEHGLHVWFGFYDNAFRMTRSVFDELDRPAHHPIPDIERAFDGCDDLVVADRSGPTSHTFHIRFPRNGAELGGEHVLPGFWEITASMCEWAARRLERVEHRRAYPLRAAARLLRLAGPHVAALITHPRVAGGDRRHRRSEVAARLLAASLTRARDCLWERVVRDRCEADARLRLFFTTFDTFASALAGIVADGVLEHGWEVINDRDLCEWLVDHGAKQVTVGVTPAQRAPLLRAVYDLAFAYPGGDVAAANAAAGAAMSNLLRLLFTYRGSVLYKMRAGMGDTVVAPMFEVLCRRGVRFEFFHAATGIRLSEDGTLVDGVEVVPQVGLAGGAYDPLIPVEGLDCWPNEPLWDQLEDGERLRARGIDFEQQANPLDCEPRVLRRGEDFDSVVLAIPVGALHAIASETAAAHPRFARMLRSAQTVSTQGIQMWLSNTSAQLGWSWGENSVGETPDELLSTWCDMSYLLAAEGWPEETNVNGLAYLCGILPEPYLEGANASPASVRDNARQFLESHAGSLWPAAVRVAGGNGFDWAVLADPEDRTGPARLEAQYCRANTHGSDRYVLSTAGSIARRLRAGESGVENLVLAGDWTRNGIDGGCVEAAVTSGMQAARVLLGHRRPILGESPTWLTDGPARARAMAHRSALPV